MNIILFLSLYNNFPKQKCKEKNNKLQKNKEKNKNNGVNRQDVQL